MKELSLHILDIVQNSISAEANRIEIQIIENSKTDTLSINIIDNGRGMAPHVLAQVLDPYTTSRTTRKVGMGLPLLNDACKSTGGELTIESEPGKGTRVMATLGLSHIDRQPLGDIAGVVVMLIAANPTLRFIYSHTKDENSFTLDTDEVKEVLEGVPIETPEVGRMLREMVNSNLDEL